MSLEEIGAAEGALEPGVLPDAGPRRIGREERRAFEAALVQVTPELRRLARYYVGSNDAAEDVLQSTLLTAIERIASYDPQRQLAPWLIGILLNKVAAQRRERRPQRMDSEPDHMLEPSSEAIAESNEVERLVEDGLRQLPPKYREVLELHLREGKQGGEIAATLMRPPGTIRAQIHRGLTRLRALLPGSLALGTLVAFFTGRARADARPRGAPGDPARGGPRLQTSTRRTPVASLPRAHAPALSIAAGVLVVGAGWFALSRGSDSARGVRGAELDASGALARADGTLTDHRTPTEVGPREALTAPAAGTSAPAAAALVVHAFDRRTRGPVEGVALRTVVETATGERVEGTSTTDAAGDARIALPDEPVERLTVRSRRAGFTPFWSVWNRGSSALDGEHALAIPMHASRAIGGTLVDENDRPVSGALVQASIVMLTDEELWGTAPEELVGRTDDQGRWRIEDASSYPGQLHLRFAHPDHVSELHYDDRRSPSPQDLWDGTSRIVLARGRPIELRVLDPRGAPVAGASVGLLERRDPPHNVTRFTTAADGTLSYAAPTDDVYLVHVEAPGFAARTLVLEQDPRDLIEVRLEPPVRVALRIEDENGAPVADARIRRFGSTWDETSATSASGVVELDLSPERPTFLAIRRPGFLGFSVAKVAASASSVRLPRPARFAGHVLDASTGAPVPGARLRLLGKDGGEIAARRLAADGAFELAFYPSGAPGAFLEASAVGHETTRSAELSTAGERTVDLALPSAEALELLAVDAAGLPVDYAELAVCQRDAPASLTEGGLYPAAGRSKVCARGDGVLRLNRPAGEFALAIVSQSGFAFVRDSELASDGRIKTLGWGRVEGTAAPGEELVLEPEGDYPGLDFALTGRADEDGKFYVRGLPSGPVRIRAKADPSAAVVIDMVPGATTKTVLP